MPFSLFPFFLLLQALITHARRDSFVPHLMLLHATDAFTLRRSISEDSTPEFALLLGPSFWWWRRKTVVVVASSAFSSPALFRSSFPPLCWLDDKTWLDTHLEVGTSALSPLFMVWINPYANPPKMDTLAKFCVFRKIALEMFVIIILLLLLVDNKCTVTSVSVLWGHGP